VRWGSTLACVLVLGCNFDPSGTLADSPGGGGGGDSDAGAGAGGPAVSHLDEADALPGTGPFVLGDANIDTTALTIDVALPAGVTFEAAPQLVGGPDLAVLRVSELSISADATVRVRGDRPLVVIASGAISILGSLDAAASRAEPGPGGAPPGLDLPTRGGPGINDGNIGDSGGGGGGCATPGAIGGDAGSDFATISVTGGTGGLAKGDVNLSRLEGGGAGGVGSPCMTDPGGAGGGAVQLSSLDSIDIDGVIATGGGGGGRGYICPGTGGSGGGGGAGGAIFVEAPVINVGGVLAANGGGGGSGSDSPAGLFGFFGEDGRNDGSSAPGGTRPVSNDTVGVEGGAGGAGTIAPGAGASTTWGNGGGGGGSVGRIVVRSAGGDVSGATSPAATLAPY
jgi:hypothetical protein